MNVNEILLRLRIEKGVYQKELASYLKVSIGTISNYEKGIHSPDLNTLCMLADYFDVTTDYLLGRTTSRHNSDTLSRPLTKGYLVSDLLNTTLDLPPQDISRLVDYAELLKRAGAAKS